MKLKQIIVGITLNLALLSPAAHADILFQSAKSGDICDNVAGTWSGTGTVSGTIFKLTCEYKGTAVVTSETVPYNYTFKVSLQKTSGMLCPNNEETTLKGFCDPIAKRIVLNSSEADLSGSTDGKSAALDGKVRMKLMGKVITADVKMGLNKQ